jgi:hypothetical protein
LWDKQKNAPEQGNISSKSGLGSESGSGIEIQSPAGKAHGDGQACSSPHSSLPRGRGAGAVGRRSWSEEPPASICHEQHFPENGNPWQKQAEIQDCTGQLSCLPVGHITTLEYVSRPENSGAF